MVETWAGRAQRRLQARMDREYAAWRAGPGKHWNGKGSPYAKGFAVPDCVTELMDAIRKGDEVRAKALVLTHFLDD